MFYEIIVSDLRTSHIQALYNRLSDEGLTGKSIKAIAAPLQQALKTALSLGMIPTNPAVNAQRPGLVEKEISPLTESEIGAFLTAIQGDSLENALAVCLLTGTRKAELLGLSWNHVDFKNGTITVSQQLQYTKSAGWFILPRTKSGRPRTISPPPLAFEYLKAEQKKQKAAKLAAGEAFSNPWNLVFTNALGCHVTFTMFMNHFKHTAAKIGRPDASPHTLRHTAATVALASGVDAKSVQQLLGHASASFTLDKYGHASDQMKQAAAAKMQGFYDALQA